MNKKIVSLILCAAVATAGIFAANIDTANAQTTLSIEQMEQIIASLRQQIAQIVAILQARNNSTTPNGTANWLTYQDKTNGIEFEYPAKFQDDGFSSTIWPPKVSVTDINQDPLANQPEGEATSYVENGSLANATKNVSIGNYTFDIYQSQDGAMGRQYFNYAYVTKKDGKNYTVYFSVIADSGCIDGIGAWGTGAYCKQVDVAKDIEQPIRTIMSTLKIGTGSNISSLVTELVPSDADISTCIDGLGKTWATTGTTSYADWFLWNGCAKDKEYIVRTANSGTGVQPVILSFHGDNCPTCHCQYPKFKVYENNTGIWTDVADIDFSNLPIPANAGKIINAHDYFYQPMSSSQIRIEAQNCFYLRVYTGEAADLKRQFPDWEQLTTIYHCGNGACDSGENFVTCPLDCQ